MNKLFNNFLTLCLLVSVTGFAQTTNPEPTYEDKESAKIHFEAAKKLYKNDKYSEAMELFKKAYSRYPKPEILYNIGKCYDKLGDYPNAIKFYEQYVLLNPQAEDRAEVEELIKNLKEAVKKPETSSTQTTHLEKKKTNKIIGYSLAGSGLVFLALGPFFYLQADSIYNDVENNKYPIDKRKTKIDEINTYDNLSVACYITGGILIGASAYFLYKGYKTKTSISLIGQREKLYIGLNGEF